MNVDLNAITVFVRVVEAGSFVGAARTLPLGKSTIARRIDELETALGVRLLHRSTRQLRLTDAGQSFYERARDIVEQVADAAASVSAQQREPSGRLRFTTSVLLGEAVVGPWLDEYLVAHPKVQLEMYLAPRKVDLLGEGFDLALRIGQLESSNHIVRRLAPAPQYLCASPSYLAERGSPRTTDELRDHRCIVYAPDRGDAPWLLHDERGDTVKVAVSGPLLVNSHPVALAACRGGLGVAQLPALICCDALRSGELMRVLPGWSMVHWMHALYPSRRHLSATARTFLDFLAERLEPAPWLVD